MLVSFYQYQHGSCPVIFHYMCYMLQLLRPNSSNLPCLYSTFHLEYPLVLSRFCLERRLRLNQTYPLSIQARRKQFKSGGAKFLISK